jgi:hypothetical protein
MSLVKTPVIKKSVNLQDLIDNMDQLQVFFSAVQKNGGSLTAQDLINTGLVDNSLVISKKMVTK